MVWGRFIGYIKRKSDERRAKRNEETSADRAARSTARATWWIAGFTCVLVGTSLLQWKEIHDGGKDTHDLAVAAQTQAANLKTLADHMKDQADRTKELADDNHNMLEGTQAAFMTFAVRTEIPFRTVEFDGGNNGNAEAREFYAHETIAVMSWPSKSVRLGPFGHSLQSKRIAKGGGMGANGFLRDVYAIPNITPEIASDLDKGDAYVTVRWQASYENGFGVRVHWPAKEICQAWIDVGPVKCQTAPNSFMDNHYVGEGPCATIDSLRQSREQDMSDAQKTCKKPI